MAGDGPGCDDRHRMRHHFMVALPVYQANDRDLSGTQAIAGVKGASTGFVYSNVACPRYMQYAPLCHSSTLLITTVAAHGGIRGEGWFVFNGTLPSPMNAQMSQRV